MAVEQIKGERAIRALEPGAGRLNDGGGLYLVPFAWGNSHAWRLDYTCHGRRRTLSLGTYPKVRLNEARTMARTARSRLAEGVDPLDERRTQRLQDRLAQEQVRRVQTESRSIK